MKKQCTLFPCAREYTPPLCETLTVRQEHSFLASGDPDTYDIPEVEEEDEDWD